MSEGRFKRSCPALLHNQKGAARWREFWRRSKNGCKDSQTVSLDGCSRALCGMVTLGATSASEAREVVTRESDCWMGALRLQRSEVNQLTGVGVSRKSEPQGTQARLRWGGWSARVRG